MMRVSTPGSTKLSPSILPAPSTFLRPKIGVIYPLPFNVHNSKQFGFQISLFIRMLYSCLVDADFLDTEMFMDRGKSLWRKGYPSLPDLDKTLNSALRQLTEGAPRTAINQYRAEILRDCFGAADKPHGLFSLTVPTGGGKTLSSLAFAMKHALTHNLKRIIYVIPYTSIIEQKCGCFQRDSWRRCGAGAPQ